MSFWAEPRPVALSLCLCALAAAAPVQAKVSFTGYGHFLFTPDANLRLSVPTSLVPGAEAGVFRARGFATESLGLFAATPVGEDADFLMDVSYRGVGGTVRDLRVQYAYLETPLPWGLRLQAGKVTLPLGYFNTRRFYPFQRVELTAPLFQSVALGLPIADTGGIVSYHGESSELDLDVRLFGVNGYGSVPASTASFRNPALAGGLEISNNLGAGNNNRDVAVGGQVALSQAASWEYGISYYRGAWDRSGERLFQLSGSHLHWTPGRFDVLLEYLRLSVDGDQGMHRAFDREDWALDGGFVTLSAPIGTPFGRPLKGYLRGEFYDGSARDGTGGHELLRSGAAGFAFKESDWITWKGEYLWLDYRVPSTSSTTLQLMGYVARLALVVTF